MEILVVDDDPERRASLARALEHAGYRVRAAADGTQALGLLAATRPRLVVLDAGLPGIDGFEVCRRIRRDSQVPVMMLAARDGEDDVLRGFRLGVDDYLAAPLSIRILVARVAAVLRRATEGSRRDRDRRVRAGGLKVDLECGEVRRGGQQIEGTPLERRPLNLLAVNAGRVVPYDRLVAYAWGHDGGSPARLKIRIFSIRKKPGLPVGGEAGIKAVVGTGYTLHGL